MNTADTFKMKMLDDRQCVAVSAAVLAADKPLLRRLGQGAFNEYANRLSSLMRESIVESDDFGNDFEDVSAEITSPMRYAHHLINDCGVAVISAQDEEQGVHMQPVKVEFNDKRLVSNIGAYCADGNLETFAARAETQVKSTANELVKVNAEARYKAGFDVKITRIGADRCCDWCAKRIGQWTIDNAPDGVFGCHDNCKCTVEYRNSKGVTSRRTGRVGAFVEVDYKPHVGVVQNGENQPQGLTSGANGGNIGTRLPDIVIGRSLGAKAKNYDIMDLNTGEHFNLIEGSHLQNVEVFAGKGGYKPYEKAQVYADKYGGNPRDWQHVKGYGEVDYYGESRNAELHWSQCDGVGKHDFFIKRWLE